MTPTAIAQERKRLNLDGVNLDPHALHAAREPSADDRLWIADLSQIWAANAWLYFAFVIDRHSRHCRGISTHRVLHAGLVAGAIVKAVGSHRSDGAGTHEPAIVFSRRCYSAGVDFPSWAVPSAGDIAISEAFLGSLRMALLDDGEGDTWTSQGEATTSISDWISCSYNCSPVAG